MRQEHILIVDDDEMMAQVIKILLQRLGYGVTF